MFHLDNTSAVPEMPEPKEPQSNSPRWFGESQQQGGISWPGADWFNITQAELLNILKEAGIDASKIEYDQLAKSVKKIAMLNAVLGDYFGRGTIGQNIRECANILAFEAEPFPADSTTAFKAAYATGKKVYVPIGTWKTDIFHPLETFGDGEVFSGDSRFTDSGMRPISSNPNTGQAIVEHIETWGNVERAAARSIIVNNPTARTQVSNFREPSQYATYVNSDHVGQYIGMYGPRNQIRTTATASTYTAKTLTAPEIMAGADIRQGMFIATSHSPRYKAKVMSVDFSTNTITVDGWYAAGNTTTDQIPVNGYSAIINAADKMWGKNIVVFIDDKSSVRTATGIELGFSVTTTPGNPVWGFHAANYDGYLLNDAFKATGKWLTGLNMASQVQYGVQHSVGADSRATLYISNIADDSWTGDALRVNTNWRKSSSSIISVMTGGVEHFRIDTLGVRSVVRESVVVVSSNVSIYGLTQSTILCNNPANKPITISYTTAQFVAGQELRIRATGGEVSFAGFTLNSASGRFLWVVFDGNQFIKLCQSN